MRIPRRWWVVGILWVAVTAGSASGEQHAWQTYTESGRVAYRHGDYTQAEQLFTMALREAERCGPQTICVATSLNNLAILRRAQGQYTQAEPLLQRALTITEHTLGTEHPRVAMSLNNLAELYQLEGRHEEAESLYLRALTIWEQTSEPLYPQAAVSLHGLAKLYQALGHHPEAEALYRGAVIIWKQTLGPQHPYVAMSLSNLAALYRAQGQSARAEALERQVRAMAERASDGERVYPMAHLDTAAPQFRSGRDMVAIEPGVNPRGREAGQGVEYPWPADQETYTEGSLQCCLVSLDGTSP